MSLLDNLTGGGGLWLVWIGLFAAIEFPALFNKKKGDTLSEVLRYWLGFSKRSQVQGQMMVFRRGMFYFFTLWFVLHIQGKV